MSSTKKETEAKLDTSQKIIEDVYINASIVSSTMLGQALASVTEIKRKILKILGIILQIREKVINF